MRRHALLLRPATFPSLHAARDVGSQGHHLAPRGTCWPRLCLLCLDGQQCSLCGADVRLTGALLEPRARQIDGLNACWAPRLAGGRASGDPSHTSQLLPVPCLLTDCSASRHSREGLHRRWLCPKAGGRHAGLMRPVAPSEASPAQGSIWHWQHFGPLDRGLLHARACRRHAGARQCPTSASCGMPALAWRGGKLLSGLCCPSAGCGGQLHSRRLTLPSIWCRCPALSGLRTRLSSGLRWQQAGSCGCLQELASIRDSLQACPFAGGTAAVWLHAAQPPLPGSSTLTAACGPGLWHQTPSQPLTQSTYCNAIRPDRFRIANDRGAIVARWPDEWHRLSNSMHAKHIEAQNSHVSAWEHLEEISSVPADPK